MFLTESTQLETNPLLQVATTSGTLQGRRLFTSGGSKALYYAFLGIPYAEPPVDELRFRSPVPKKPWTGVLDATREGQPCLQSSPKIEELFTVGSEDCLFLNVYTTTSPKVAGNATLSPVMVWIYGGAFASGDSGFSTYGPDFLLEQGIVVVTFNYRVGMLGFLSTGDLNAPGNYGLKDQIAVLRWIQTNVHLFGGDPHRVTLFGQSAGAAAVQYLMQTAAADGLFHAAIAESGSSLCPWAFQRDPRKVAFEVGVASGIITFDTKDLVERLRKVNYSRWTELGASVLNLINPLNGLPFAPTIEPEHEDAVITRRTYELLRNGHIHRVPFVTGVNSQESAMFLQLLDMARPFIAQWDIFPPILVPDDMNTSGFGNKLQAALAIKDFYFGSKPATISTKQELLNYVSDNQFIRPIRASAALTSRHAPVYFYVFSYEGHLGINGNDQRQRNGRGVAHSEEMWYIWRKENLTTSTSADELVRERLVRMWTNFARFRNPTPSTDPLLQNVTWPQVEANGDFEYLEIGANLKVKKNLRTEAMTFWNDLYEKYGRPPYDTY